MAKISCPHCGAPVESNRSMCPNCHADIRKKSSLTPYLIVAGISGVIILIVAVILLLPAPKPAAQPLPQVTAPPAAPAPVKAASPSCTIAINGRKNTPTTIQLQVMTSTCSASEITELSVSVNGEKKGTLASGPGSSGTFTGASGTSNVIVTGKFSNGAESVVYQNAAL